MKLGKNPKSDPITVFLAVFLAVFLLSTWKYVKDGDAYIFQTPTPDNFIDLNGSLVTQEIFVDELAKWNNRSYSVFFHVSGEADPGSYIHLELSQKDNAIDSYDLPVRWLKEGFNELKWMHFSRLEPGAYQLSVSGDIGQAVSVGVCENLYNLPNCFANGRDTGFTLAQTYHFNFANFSYWMGIGLFVVLIGMCIFTAYLCVLRQERAAGVLRITLIATYIILAYEYDCHAFYQPLWAEAVTNFMHYSINQSWWKCLPIPDTSYLPLAQRLIAIIVFNFLDISPYAGVYVMQIAAYVITGVVISFFAKPQFSAVLDIRFRYIFSVILMMIAINRGTEYEVTYFINFIVFGVYVFFLYFLVDSKKWSRGEFLIICAWVFLQCLSKGVNVTMLPFCILCLILFWRGYSRRDKVILSACALGAMLQLVYYVGYGIPHSWTYPMASTGGEFYFTKLLLGIVVDTPNWILSPLGEKVTMLNGIAMPIIIIFWAVVLFAFAREVLFKLRKREAVAREWRVFFMAIIFIMAQSLFLRFRVMGNTKQLASDDFWSFQNFGNIGRHTMNIFLAVMLAYIVVLHIVERQYGGARKCLAVWAAFLAIICIANPRMQIKGFWNDDYEIASSTLANNNAEAFLLKGIKEAECRVVPMLWDEWIYKKNAQCYCFGQDVLGWQGLDAIVFDSGQPQKGSFAYPRSLGVDTSVPIYQVFVCKNCLVGANKWQVILYDDSGNVLLRQEQDNMEYQRIASFTFDEGISNISRIQIVDGKGNSVSMENAMYIVTKEGEKLAR